MKGVSFGCVVLLVALGTVGCVDDDKSFYIDENLVPSKGCVASPSATLFRTHGYLDLSGGMGYYLFPLVVNYMTATATADKQPERNRLHMRRFAVELDMGPIPLSLPDEERSFSVPVASTIDPGGGKAAFAGVEILQDKSAARLKSLVKTQKPTIFAHVRAVGDRSGDEIESAEFIYPITLCSGCLVDLRTSCPSSTDTTVLSNTCGLPQDEAVTCCPDSTQGGKIVCYRTSSSSSGS